MIRSIMVPLENWRTDQKAVGIAVQLGQSAAAGVHLVHVQSAGNKPRAGGSERVALRDSTDAVRIGASDVAFRIINTTLKGTRRDRIARSLAGYAADHAIDLTILSRRAQHSDRLTLGAVGRELITLLDSPVLVVSASEHADLAHARVLVVLSDPDADEKIVDDAVDLAGMLAGVVVPIQPVPTDTLQETAAARHCQVVAISPILELAEGARATAPVVELLRNLHMSVLIRPQPHSTHVDHVHAPQTPTPRNGVLI